MEEAYENVNVNEYSCEVEEVETTFECMVSCHAANANMYSVTIPKVSCYGSRLEVQLWCPPMQWKALRTHDCVGQRWTDQ